MELRQYASLVLRWWWLLLLATLLAAGSGYYVSKQQPPIYRASATLLVNPAQDGRGPNYTDVLAGQQLVVTYAELVRKAPVLDAAIAKLGLPYRASELAERIQVRVVRDTMILELSADDVDPGRARDMANAVAEAFITQRREDQLGQSSASRDMLRKQISDLEQEITATSRALQEARAARAPDAVEITRLQSDLSQAQLTYSQLVRGEQEMQLAEARAFNSIKVVEPAALPEKPVSPKVAQNTLLAALAGLLLALGAAFLIEYLDDTVKKADDVQRTVQLATLAVVGRIPVAKGTDREPRVLAEPAARSSLGESYRILRMNIDFSWAGAPGRVLMVTSANPREGKTTTLANIAMVLAKDNRRVVMVDADLRRPSLHRAFGLGATPGLTNLLADPAARAPDFVRPTALPNLALLPSGAIPPNPSELLGSPRFAAVLEELKALADVVLIDTPPALAVADPALVAKRADGVVLVVEAGGARAGALVRATEMLARAEARVLGVVLNKLSPRSADYYYHYYYRHYYGVKPSSSNGSGKPAQEVKR